MSLFVLYCQKIYLTIIITSELCYERIIIYPYDRFNWYFIKELASKKWLRFLDDFYWRHFDANCPQVTRKSSIEFDNFQLQILVGGKYGHVTMPLFCWLILIFLHLTRCELEKWSIKYIQRKSITYCTDVSTSIWVHASSLRVSYARALFRFFCVWYKHIVFLKKKWWGIIEVW